MDALAKIQYALGWASVAHIAMLTVWFLAYRFARGILRPLQVWFVPTLGKDDLFDKIFLSCMAYYKVSTLLFFVIPYLALRFSP